MLVEPTLERLNAMKLYGMADALRHFVEAPKKPDITPPDLVAMLADAEWLSRENRALSGRLRRAAFRINACVEDIDYALQRGLHKPLMLELASSRWVKANKNIIITGPAGAGKSHIACALGNKACRDGFTVMYRRMTRLLDELAQARVDGSMPLLLRKYAKANVLVIDDFGPTTLNANERRDLLEVLDDRYDVASTVITSQLEPSLWHAVIGDVTIADSICDRLVHNAHRIKLSAAESFRKAREKSERLTGQNTSAK